jgi:hypothetical protein
MKPTLRPKRLATKGALVSIIGNTTGNTVCSRGDRIHFFRKNLACQLAGNRACWIGFLYKHADYPFLSRCTNYLISMVHLTLPITAIQISTKVP